MLNYVCCVVYPAITNSDDEDTKDATWQPPINILTPSERLSLKNMKCLNPKVGKSVPKKNKKTTKEPAAKRLVCCVYIYFNYLTLKYLYF